MKHIFVITVAATALAVTGCGTVQAGQETGQAAHAPAAEGSSPIDAAIVDSGFGWVLTPEQLLVSRDGGRTFTDAQVPLPATASRAAFFRDAANGYVTASIGGTVRTARTQDGGRTWRTTAARGPAPEYGRLRMAFGDASHGAIVAETSGGAMSSTATLFTSADGGATWSPRRAPVAGEVSVEAGGRIWLAGGVAHDQLYRSADQGRSWDRAELRLDAAATTQAVAPPVGGVVPVTTVTSADQTQVALLTTADKGRTWQERNRVALQGRTGPGVLVPVTATRSGPLVLDTGGRHAYRLPLSGTAQDLRPAALPEGADAVTFAPDGNTGWVLATYGRCANGKSDCTLYSPLLTTADGGATWQQARMWQRKLN